MELCWLTTGRCNESCKYCDRFHSDKDLSDEELNIIIDKLLDYEIKQLTFGGGESLLISCFDQIVRKASGKGIHLKLVTNGILIPKYWEIIDYFDEITLSLDTLDALTNEKLGRGINHFETVSQAIDVIAKSNQRTRININTVATRVNIEQILGMKEFIEKWNISQWRIFRFCPLRETAVNNKDEYEISDKQFSELCNTIKQAGLVCNVQFRNHADMEKGYLLINPHGKLCVSRNMKDEIVGDMLKDDLRQWFI